MEGAGRHLISDDEMSNVALFPFLLFECAQVLAVLVFMALNHADRREISFSPNQHISNTLAHWIHSNGKERDAARARVSSGAEKNNSCCARPSLQPASKTTETTFGERGHRWAADA